MVINQRQADCQNKAYHDSNDLFGYQRSVHIGSAAQNQNSNNIEQKNLNQYTEIIVFKIIIKKHILMIPLSRQNAEGNPGLKERAQNLYFYPIRFHLGVF